SIRGDVQRLELALVNVLRNAVQAAQKEVRIAWHQEHTELVLSVHDDGAGLAADFSGDDVTKPFVTTKAQGEGTGLGLAIVQYVITDHGGDVDLHNHPDGGCEVHLRLPLAVAQEAS